MSGYDYPTHSRHKAYSTDSSTTDHWYSYATSSVTALTLFSSDMTIPLYISSVHTRIDHLIINSLITHGRRLSPFSISRIGEKDYECCSPRCNEREETACGRQWGRGRSIHCLVEDVKCTGSDRRTRESDHISGTNKLYTRRAV